MNLAIAAFGLFVFAMGALGMIQPTGLMSVVERPWRTPLGLYMAMIFRLALGLLLLAGASSTRFPWVVGGLGAVSLLAAAAIPLIGFERLQRFVEWWLERPPAFIRAWAVVACLFGAFLILAAV